MPHFEVGDGAVKVNVEIIPTKKVTGASENIGSVSVSLGSGEVPILIHLHGATRHSYNHMRPGASVPTARK